MNIKIIALDKISGKFTKDAVSEYSKRLTKYCKLTYKECKNEAQLVKEISDKSYFIHISSEGELLSSEELAEKFSELGLSGKSDITFLLSPEKLTSYIVQKIDLSLAISRMDIDFGVLLVVMYEQIYRAYRILSNEPYHK